MTASSDGARLAVCVPVWNRGDLFRASFDSLIAQLDGVQASIWIFDNGSRPSTQREIQRSRVAPPHQLFKIQHPKNMGIPFVINTFCRVVAEASDYADYTPAEFVMVADADAYFKRPVKDMIDILATADNIGIVSGHDSVEHPAVGSYDMEIDGRVVPVREKEVERGLCLVMRTEVLLAGYPFPHDTNLDFDWEIMKRNPHSMAARKKRVVALDSVVHLGLYESTWSEMGVPATVDEVDEIDSILSDLGLLTERRRAHREKFLQSSPELRPSGISYSESPEDFSPGFGPVHEPTPDDHASPSQIVVLGMHRSGTSLVTRFLHQMGCFVGRDEELLGSDEANPTGYWERRDVLALNQKLLADSDADVYRVGHLEPPTRRFRECSELESGARRIVEYLEENRPWAIKDPRLCLTLPFWRRALESPVCVLVFRSPLEVAKSLWTRDFLAVPYSFSLWEKYYVEALENTRGLRRVLVSHQQLLQEPVRTVDRLHRDLAAYGVESLHPLEYTAILRIVDPSLHRHHRDDIVEREYLNARQADLLAALNDGSAIDGDVEFRLSRAADDILSTYPVSLDLEMVRNFSKHGQPQSDTPQAAVRDLSNDLLIAQMRRDIQDRESEISEFRVAAERIGDEHEELRHELALSEEEREKLGGRIASLEKSYQKSRESSALLERWIGELESIVAAIQASRSWKLGSTVSEMTRWLFRRSRQPSAFDRHDEVMRKFRDWKSGCGS